MKFSEIYRCATTKINLLASDNGSYSISLIKGEHEIWSMTGSYDQIKNRLIDELSSRLFQSICLGLQDFADLESDDYSVRITGFIRETKEFK